MGAPRLVESLIQQAGQNLADMTRLTRRQSCLNKVPAWRRLIVTQQRSHCPTNSDVGGIRRLIKVRRDWFCLSCDLKVFSSCNVSSLDHTMFFPKRFALHALARGTIPQSVWLRAKHNTVHVCEPRETKPIHAEVRLNEGPHKVFLQ